VSPNSQLPPRVLYSTHTPRHIIQKPNQTTILLRIFSHPASDRHTRKVFSAMFRLLFRFVSFLFCSAPARNVSDVCVCVCVHKQSKAKQRKKEIGKNIRITSCHGQDRTGQDRTLYGPIYKTKATKGAFCFFPSCFFWVIPRTVLDYLSIYLSIGKQLGEVQGGREGGNSRGLGVRLSDIPFLTDLLPSLRGSVWFIGGGWKRDG